MASQMAALLWKLPRSRLLRLRDDFVAISPAHDAVIQEASKALADRVEKDRAMLMPTDPATERRICNLQNSLRYKFRNPMLAKYVLTHDTYPSKNSDDLNIYKELAFLGDRIVGAITRLRLQNPHPLVIEKEEGQEFFSRHIVGRIFSAVTSNDYLGRAALELGLYDNLMHASKTNVRENVKSFQLAVENGRYDVKAEKILADSFEACAGGVYLDCGCPNVFYKHFIHHIRIDENPVYIMYNQFQSPGYKLCKVSHENGLWKVTNADRLVVEEKTLMLAADTFNKISAADGTNKAASVVNAKKLDEETEVLSHDQ